MSLVEGLVDPLDYAAAAFRLALESPVLAEALLLSVLPYFDSENIVGSELAYLAAALLILDRRGVPEDVRPSLPHYKYSPDPVVACRARQILEGELDAGALDRGYPKPCLALVAHRGKPNIYVIH